MATRVSEASITCSICLGRFRKPRILPCVHSYCQDCLLTYAPPGTSSMKCPLCKDEIKIPDGDVTKFKLDFRLQGQVDDAINYEKLATGTSPILACNCCNEEQEAVGRCLDCEQFLCDFGMKSHTRLSSLQGHNVYSLDEIKHGTIKPKLSKRRMCERHPDEKARYYCHTCLDFICRECVVLDHPRPDHEYTSTVDAAKKYKEIVSEKAPLVATVKHAFEASKTLASNMLKDIDDESEAANEQIRQEAATLRAIIDAEERRRLDDVAKLKRERSDEVQKYKTNFECVGDCSNHIYETSIQLLETGTDEEFLSYYPTLNTKMDQLIKDKPELIPMNGTYMTYLPVEDFELELGELRVEESKKWELKQTIGSEGSDAGQFLFACAVAVCENDNILVADGDEHNQRVSLFSSEGNHIQAFSSHVQNERTLFKPRDLDITADEHVVVVDRSNEVKIFDTMGKFVRKFSVSDRSGEECECYSVRVLLGSNRENIGVTYQSKTIMTLHCVTNGQFRKSVTLPYRPNALENVDENHILLSQFEPGRVDMINIMDENLKKTIDIERNQSYKYAAGVCYDPHCCQIYVSSFTENAQGKGVILRYSSNGVLLGCIAENLLNPLAIRLIGRDKMVVADTTTVKVYHNPDNMDILAQPWFSITNLGIGNQFEPILA